MGGVDLLAWVASIVGPVSPVAHAVKENGALLEVVDSDGRRWFAKVVRVQHDWAAEVNAYREWGPALADRIPDLHAADELLRTLLLTAVPGDPPGYLDTNAHREAGRVLRQLHEAVPARDGGPHPARLASRRLEAVLAEAPDLLTAEEIRFARDRTREIATLPPWPRVPCHGDYKPTNWLVDAAGVLRAVDFGLARWHVPAFDLTRLCLGPWWGRPHLAAAFFDGYGRAVTAEEEQYLNLIVVSHAVIAIRYGRAQQLSDREEFGRTRLHELMAGKTVTFTESRHRASIRRLRSAGGAVRRRLARREQQAAPHDHPE